MIVLNKKMFALLMETDVKNKTLQNGLSQIVLGGFIELENCFLLRNLSDPQMHIKRSDFFDDTAYECFINSIHVDNYVNGDFLEQGMLLMEDVFKIWKVYNVEKKLKCILSQTEFGVNVKFHVKRDDPKWIDESDIEGFEEAVIVFES